MSESYYKPCRELDIATQETKKRAVGMILTALKICDSEVVK